MNRERPTALLFETPAPDPDSSGSKRCKHRSDVLHGVVLHRSALVPWADTNS
jgi:hypothetical protein